MSITEEIKDIKGWIKEQEEKEKIVEKKWRFPFGKKVGRGQRKKNFVTTLLINENGTYTFHKYKIIDQTIIHDFIPRLATTGHTLIDKKGNPMIILPNWSVEPFSPLKHFEESLKDGSNTKGIRILGDRMLKEKLHDKPTMSPIIKWIIGLGALGTIVYIFMSGGT